MCIRDRHIWALHVPGNNNPIGIDLKKPSNDTVPFHPYIVVKDLFALLLFLIVFAFFVFYSPNILGHADNYIEANPLVTPAHIVPEWYLLPFYAILRSIPDKLFGVIAMFIYPFIAHFLFSEKPIFAGIFLGTAIHETAQVAGAGLMYQSQYNAPEAFDTATITKLIIEVTSYNIGHCCTVYCLSKQTPTIITTDVTHFT